MKVYVVSCKIERTPWELCTNYKQTCVRALRDTRPSQHWPEMSQIPVVDCSAGILNKSASIFDAIERVGFVYLTNFGIPDEEALPILIPLLSFGLNLSDSLTQSSRE